MSVQNFRRMAAAARTVVKKSADATLTFDEVDYGFIQADTTSGAVAITLPAAAEGLKGKEVRLGNIGANNLTVVVTAGFGGGGAGDDTITATLGEMAICFCDGEYWYFTHQGTAA